MEPQSADAGQRVVLFDFDGVLIRGDSFGLFLRDRYAQARWRKALVLLLAPGLLLLLPFSWRRVARVLVRIGLLGIGDAHYRELAQVFATRLVHRPHQFLREGVAALRRHVAAGERVVVVTGCEETLARGVLAGLGITGVEVVASQVRAGRLGIRTVWHNVGRHKVEALARHGVTAWQRAYSDSGQDLPMLALADEPVLVNAEPKLCKRVEMALGRSVRRVQWC